MSIQFYWILVWFPFELYASCKPSRYCLPGSRLGHGSAEGAAPGYGGTGFQPQFIVECRLLFRSSTKDTKCNACGSGEIFNKTPKTGKTYQLRWITCFKSFTGFIYFWTRKDFWTQIKLIQQISQWLMPSAVGDFLIKHLKHRKLGHLRWRMVF